MYTGVVLPSAQSALIGDEEATTHVVENASNPVFNHAAELRPVGADAWGRLCGPSAAMVFRVWRRAFRSRWDASRTGRAIDGGNSGSVDDRGARQEEGVKMNTEATPATPQLGDKLIGSAVVRLEVLRGVVGTHEGVGLGLQEIDGWYHVLDDLQRPQGQIKVNECGRLRGYEPAGLCSDLFRRIDMLPSIADPRMRAQHRTNIFLCFLSRFPGQSTGACDSSTTRRYARSTACTLRASPDGHHAAGYRRHGNRQTPPSGDARTVASFR